MGEHAEKGYSMDRYQKWYSRVTWAGIIVNMLFVIPCFFAPMWLLGLLHIPLDQPIWAQTAGMLLFIISVFYIPATWDLNRYRATAWFTVFPSRTCGAVFFLVSVLALGEPLGFLSIALVDAFFGLATLAILLLVTREERRTGHRVTLK